MVGSFGAEGGRRLLQNDDDSDADGKAFDHGPGDVADGAAEAQCARDGDDDAGEQGDDGDRLNALADDDGGEHDDHGTGGAGDLDVRATKHGGDEPRDDGGDEPGFSADSGAHAEGEREG